MNTSAPLVLKKMNTRVERWERQQDQRAIFLRCYALMTQNMFATLDRHEFQDRVWVGKLLRHFAGYYFNALKTYERDPRTAPRVWRLAFDTAQNPQSVVFQHLLLGVNAHINYDLVLVLDDLLLKDWGTLSPDQQQGRRADHNRINDVIGDTIDVVQNQIVNRAIPAMRIVDKLLGPVDEWMISNLITRWRDQVWENAIQLIETRAQRKRAAFIRQIETTTLQRGRAILLKDGWHTWSDLLM